MPVRIFQTKRFEETGEVAIIGATQAEVIAEAGKYAHAAVIVENQSGLGEITYAQIKWFKGILLAGLSANGDSVGYWEEKLKLAVMPDQFAWKTTKTENGEFEHLPSIKILNKAEMGELIVGSVAHLHNEELYGDEYLWVTLPDEDLRS